MSNHIVARTLALTLESPGADRVTLPIVYSHQNTSSKKQVGRKSWSQQQVKGPSSLPEFVLLFVQAMAFLDTPQTDAGNATYLTNGHDLDLSFEKSFLPPLKKRDNLVSQLPNMRRLDSKTPRSRAPFADRGNPPAGPVRGEFTPLLKSVSKKNLSRNGVQNGVPQTPAFLKADYKGNNTPALPALTSSMVYEDHTGSSVEQVDEGTPVPQAVSSSAHSTPLAALPKRDGDDVLADQGNAMTLREQENVSQVHTFWKVLGADWLG